MRTADAYHYITNTQRNAQRNASLFILPELVHEPFLFVKRRRYVGLIHLIPPPLSECSSG